MLQNETKGQNQQRVSRVQYDWVRIFTPKVWPRSMKVVVYEDEAGGFRWRLVAENGEIVADSAEGYRHKSYAITMAEKLNPNAQLVIDDCSAD